MILKKLAELADKLDQMGYTKEAGEVDEILKILINKGARDESLTESTSE